MKILISHFGTSVNNKDLFELVAPYGQVENAEVAVDLFTGLSRGFGFVDMPDEAEAKEAIKALNRSEWKGTVITAEESKQPVHRGSYPVGRGVIKTFRFKKT